MELTILNQNKGTDRNSRICVALCQLLIQIQSVAEQIHRTLHTLSLPMQQLTYHF